MPDRSFIKRESADIMLFYLLPDEYHNDIYEIDIESLAAAGKKGFICDIDNTLVPYEEPEPTEKLRQWFDRAAASGMKISFVSNNDAGRVELFNRTLGVFAAPDAGKPSRRQLKAAMAAMDTDCGSTVMLGDQIFTDVFAGKRLGLYCILVKPIRDKKTFLFRFKRALEKPLLALYEARRKIRSKRQS